MPLSPIFQLDCGGQLFLESKPECPEETIYPTRVSGRNHLPNESVRKKPSI